MAGGTASATVTVSVTSAPVPPTAAADSVDAVSAHTVDVPVLQNDNDPAGLSLTITEGGPAGHGTVSCLADACHYRSAIGYSGTDEFRYTIRSESGLTAVGTVTVTVTPNGTPVVADQQATITSATPLTVNVLNGSSDPESDPLTVTGNSSPAHGTATCGSATCTYTSIAGYAGDDSFSYSASDGAGGSSDGTVWVTVIENTAPNVTDDTGVTRVGRTTALTIDVVGNDVDAQTPVADTDLAVVTPPAHGTVTCGPRGFEQCHYLAEPTFVGADSFTYRLTDPAGASAVGTVSITVTENHPPAITDPELATFKEIPVSRDVLSYASDPDGDAVSLRIGDQPAHGVVACDPTGTCTYEPAADFVGDDSYTVVVTDGELSITGTVSVVVRPYCYPAVCIDNGTVLLAVNPYGELNSPDGTGSKAGPGSVGLDFLATNNDATAAGCLCEGWGVANPQTGTAGYANVSSDGGAVNLTLESFTWTASSAVSVVRVGDSLRVTHDYHPSAQTPNLFEVTVTIDNISGATIPDVLYRRVMDWDIEPTAFAEYSTIDTGNASQIRFTNDNGFASANPLAPAEGPQWTCWGIRRPRAERPRRALRFRLRRDPVRRVKGVPDLLRCVGRRSGRTVGLVGGRRGGVLLRPAEHRGRSNTGHAEHVCLCLPQRRRSAGLCPDRGRRPSDGGFRDGRVGQCARQ